MKKILVVDDDRSMRMLYAEELADEGYDVVTHGGGPGLMDLIEQMGPDLVLLDIRLGEHSGLDILQEIRNAYYDLPVILCTAYLGFKYDMRSVAAEYLVEKNTNLDELKRKIRVSLEGGNPLPSSKSGIRDHEVKTGVTKRMSWQRMEQI